MKLTSVRARLQQRNFLAGRRAHLEDDVGTAHEFSGAASDPGTCGLVGLVAEVGGCPGPAFDLDGEAELDQLLDHLRDGGNTFLARVDFAWHSDR